MEKRERLGTFLVLLTALISGIAVAVHKYFIMRIDPLVFTALRAFFIGIIFLFLSLYFTRNQKTFHKVNAWWLVLIGIFGGGLAFWMYFSGLTMTMAGRAAFINKTLPLWAGVLAFIFLKEKITKKQLFAMGAMLLGLVIMQLMDLGSSIRGGDFLVLAATVLWAAENTVAKKVMLNKESNWVVTFSRMFYGSLILFAILILVGKLSLIGQLSTQQVLFVIISGILLFFYVLTWYWGLKYINLSKAAMILLIAPIITLILGMVWLGESVTVLQIVGSLFILVGGFFVIGSKSERRSIEEKMVY